MNLKHHTYRLAPAPRRNVGSAPPASSCATVVQLYARCTVWLVALALAAAVGCGASRPTSNEEVAAMSADDRPEGTGGDADEGANCDFGGNRERTCRGGLTCCYGPEYERTGYGSCHRECAQP